MNIYQEIINSPLSSDAQRTAAQKMLDLNKQLKPTVDSKPPIDTKTLLGWMDGSIPMLPEMEADYKADYKKYKEAVTPLHDAYEAASEEARVAVRKFVEEKAAAGTLPDQSGNSLACKIKNYEIDIWNHIDLWNGSNAGKRSFPSQEIEHLIAKRDAAHQVYCEKEWALRPTFASVSRSGA